MYQEDDKMKDIGQASVIGSHRLSKVEVEDEVNDSLWGFWMVGVRI